MPLLRNFKPVSSEVRRSLAWPGSKILFSAILSASLSFAATIYDSGMAAMKATDALQLGRINRTGIPSNWSEPKPYPGVLNPTLSYHYEAFVLPSIMYPYVRITVDDISGTAQTFASAYLNSYASNNTAPNFGLGTNYLGDAGFSGSLAGDGPNAFQVMMPVGGTLVLVVNDASSTGSGIGQPFRLLVEGFTSTDFNDAPEPATFGLLLAALGSGALLAGKKKRIR